MEANQNRVVVAIVDSGLNVDDERLRGAAMEGWHVTSQAMGHIALDGDFTDEVGHGTETAVGIRRFAPDALLVAVKVLGADHHVRADLIAAGIETATKRGVRIINVSLGCPDATKALLIREVCAAAVAQDIVVVGAGHPQGNTVYPGDLPEVIGVSAHRKCPAGALYHLPVAMYPRQDWGHLSGKWLTDGLLSDGSYRGSGLAAAHITGRLAAIMNNNSGISAMEAVGALEAEASTQLPSGGFR